MGASTPKDQPDWTDTVNVGNVQVQTGQDYIGSQQVDIPAASSPSYVAGAVIQVVPTALVVSLGNVQLYLKSANGYSYNGVQIVPGVQWTDGTQAAYSTFSSAIAPGTMEPYEVGKGLGFPALMNTLQVAVGQNQGTSQLADTVTLYWVAGGQTPTETVTSAGPSAVVVEGLLSGTATEVSAQQPSAGQIGLGVVPILSHGGTQHGTSGGNNVNSPGQSEAMKNIARHHVDAVALTQGAAYSVEIHSPGQSQQWIQDLQLDVDGASDGRLQIYWTNASDANASTPGAVAGTVAGWVADVYLANGGRIQVPYANNGIGSSFQNIWLNILQSGSTAAATVSGAISSTGGNVVNF